VGLPLAHPGVEHLTGVCSGDEDGVIAEDVGVAEARALFLIPVDLADGRVHVDHQPVTTGARPECPSPAQTLGHHPVQLTDMPEGEGPQERAESGRGHHPVGEHRPGITGTQQVGVIDVGAAGDDGMHQGQHLETWPCSAHSARQSHGGVDQRFQPQTNRQSGHQQKTGVGHQIGIIEGHGKTVDPARN
jgi:hypothetical protein